MSDDDRPWEDYRRDRPWSGLSYPVGRDLVERSLRAAGAVVGTLDFIVPAYAGRAAPVDQPLITVDWFSDAQSGYLSNRDRSRASHLFMRVWAVPADHRAEARALLAEGLPLACGWAAAAPGRGSAWSASAHLLTLRRGPGGLSVAET